MYLFAVAWADYTGNIRNSYAVSESDNLITVAQQIEQEYQGVEEFKLLHLAMVQEPVKVLT